MDAPLSARGKIRPQTPSEIRYGAQRDIALADGIARSDDSVASATVTPRRRPSSGSPNRRPSLSKLRPLGAGGRRGSRGSISGASTGPRSKPPTKQLPEPRYNQGMAGRRQSFSRPGRPVPTPKRTTGPHDLGESGRDSPHGRRRQRRRSIDSSADGASTPGRRAPSAGGGGHHHDRDRDRDRDRDSDYRTDGTGGGNPYAGGGRRSRGSDGRRGAGDDRGGGTPNPYGGDGRGGGTPNPYGGGGRRSRGGDRDRERERARDHHRDGGDRDRADRRGTNGANPYAGGGRRSRASRDNSGGGGSGGGGSGGGSDGAAPNPYAGGGGRRSRAGRGAGGSAGSLTSEGSGGSGDSGGENPFGGGRRSRPAAITDAHVARYEEAMARRGASRQGARPLPGMHIAASDDESDAGGRRGSTASDASAASAAGGGVASAGEGARERAAASKAGGIRMDGGAGRAGAGSGGRAKRDVTLEVDSGAVVTPDAALGREGHKMLAGFAKDGIDSPKLRAAPAWATVHGGTSLTGAADEKASKAALATSGRMSGSLSGSLARSAKALLQVTLSKFPMYWKRGAILGAGTFGKVYRGLNVMTGELFAVKQIAAEGPCGDLSSELDNLAMEVDLMKSLKHENIVRYLGTEREGHLLYVFLEYVPGGSIATILKEFGTLDEPLIAVYTRQILEGLNYLHKKRIVHRDIKGANILVNEHGICKLADFGASKQLDGSMTKSLEASLKAIRGTVPFMAPEVIRQSGHGLAADIWSLGATVIEMAQGSPPWSEFSTNLAMMFHVGTTDKVPEFPEHLSDLAKDFLDKCLRIDPASRWKTAELLRHDFVKDASLDKIPRRYALAGIGMP